MTRTVFEAEIRNTNRTNVFIFLDRRFSPCFDKAVPAEWCLVVDC